MAVQEKVYIGDRKFLYEQEHFCPQCEAKLSVCKLSWMVKPKRDTSLSQYHADGFRYVVYKLKCTACDQIYSQPEIKQIEKDAARADAKQLKKDIKANNKLLKKASKKVAKKMSKDIQKDIYKQMKEKYGIEKPKTRKSLSDVVNKIKDKLNVFKNFGQNDDRKEININISFHKS